MGIHEEHPGETKGILAGDIMESVVHTEIIANLSTAVQYVINLAMGHICVERQTLILTGGISGGTIKIIGTMIEKVLKERKENLKCCLIGM